MQMSGLLRCRLLPLLSSIRKPNYMLERSQNLSFSSNRGKSKNNKHNRDTAQRLGSIDEEYKEEMRYFSDSDAAFGDATANCGLTEDRLNHLLLMKEDTKSPRSCEIFEHPYRKSSGYLGYMEDFSKQRFTNQYSAGSLSIIEYSKATENLEAMGEAIDLTMGEAIDLTGDGGVFKTILRQPKPDAIAPTENLPLLDVHYEGILAETGEVFDTSREDNVVFTFELGKGSVISACEIALKTMKVGEIAKITCKPEYAYGSAGSPPVIPPNATLVFEVELMACKPRKGSSLSSVSDERARLEELKAERDCCCNGGGREEEERRS